MQCLIIFAYLADYAHADDPREEPDTMEKSMVRQCTQRIKDIENFKEKDKISYLAI